MATLSELVKSRRDAGQGITKSLSQSLRDKVKESIDPRKFLNQSGLLVSLFPKLKAFEAKKVTSKTKLESISPVSDSSGILLEAIQKDTQISAKNSMVLPAMHRDFNVMRQNIAKLVQLEGETPRQGADAWFKKSKVREASYEQQIGKEKESIVTPKKMKTQKSKSLLGSLLKYGAMGSLAFGAFAFSKPASASIGREPARTGGGLSFNQLSKEEQDKLLDAQYKVESGGKKTSVATRLNNPGAMAYAPWQKEFGGKKSDVKIQGTNYHFAEFPSMEMGREAQRQLWLRHGDKPIENVIKDVWSPDVTSAEHQNYVGSLYGNIGRTSSDYGMRVHPVTGQFKMHQGRDIAAPYGTPVTSVKSGIVTISEYSPTYGNYVEVDHGGGEKTRYAHLSAISVKLNDSVSEGQQIGNIGSTGRSTGPHLHFELLQDGKKINPKEILSDKTPLLSPSMKTNGQKVSEVSSEVKRDEDRQNLTSEVVLKKTNTVVKQQVSSSTVNSPFDYSKYIEERMWS